MSEWILKRDAFYKAAIQQGLTGPEGLDTVFPLGYNVPQGRVQKWLRGLTCPPSSLLTGRRFVNRFRLGADPEFVFTTEGVRGNASALSLKQGQAFGADNNGRLAEIRPYPSRSALEVVASILTTLRWMAVLKPKTLAYNWESGAFILDDGIGGHVHFGRKRPGREEEITALDAVEELLLALGIFPIDGVARRRGGDAHRQRYGQIHDFRLQAHGYEYRTFPSWLDSPALAFMTITLSKLAVCNPGICTGLQVSSIAKTNLQKIRNLLAYYRRVDNDARLALMLLERGLPRHNGGDFRERWGIPRTTAIHPTVNVIPPAIKPDEGTIKELLELFSIGRPLMFPMTFVPNWEPSTLPKGYVMCIDSVSTDQAKGFGELIWDLCVNKNLPVPISAGNRDLGGGRGIMVSSGLAKLLPSGWQNKQQVHVFHDGAAQIIIPMATREGPRAKATKDFLTSGVFPIWRVKDVKQESFTEWRSKVDKAPVKPKTFKSKVLFEYGEMPSF